VAVPLLVTIDVEVARDHDPEQQRTALVDLGDHLEALGVPSTFFVTGDAAVSYGDALRRIASGGAEIGCHGLDHTPAEDYRSLSVDEAGRRIEAASDVIESLHEVRPRCFRAPRMATSVAAQEALVRAGYAADLSVCPQRLDFGSSPGAAVGALRAPRVPYHPAADSPFRRGQRPLWVVPLSGVGLPFLSGVLYSAPAALMRWMCSVLVREAPASGGAVVFLCHSYELAERLPGSAAKRSQRRYVPSAAERRERLLGFLEHLGSRPDLEPMTVTQLLRRLDPVGVT
jgi:hypothetical protein